MPYGQNQYGQVTTPGGCRVDNGRCIQSIAWNVFQDYCAFHLRDSTYYYAGTGIGTLLAEMLSAGDPGCYWNHSLGWNRPNSGLLKVEPPHDDETDIWLVYSAPDYQPEAFTPP